MKIPLRYIDVKYEDVPKEIRASLERMRETRQGLYIHGPVGTGKTHVLWAIRKMLIKRLEENLPAQAGSYSRIYNITELIHKIRAEFDRRNGEDVLGELLEYDGILMLDDIGAEKITDWVAETFYMLINRRYEGRLPTIFTSNLPVADLAERIGDRTASRIVEMCDIFHLGGQDRRLVKVINRKDALHEKTK